MRLDNKLRHGAAHFVLPPLPPELRDAEGMIACPMVIDPQIGTEVVLLHFDRTPFIHELARVRPFELRMKAGMVSTSHGPLMFMLWYVPDPKKPGSPFFAVDVHVNPMDAGHVWPWRDLARQSKVHLLLIGEEQKLVDLFEFDNTYGLGATLDQVEDVSRGMSRGAFDLAKQEFCARYTIENLFGL